MLEIKDRQFFLEIAADAIVQAELNLTDKKERTRWVNAIAKAVRQTEKDMTFIHWQPMEKSLLIWSESNEIYSANGVCQCKAFKNGISLRNKPFPCWHRALARLVRLYFELTEVPNPRRETNAPPVNPVSEIITAPYLKIEIGQTTKVGNIRF